jgi:DNA (cytosine-5)-methyltransferase 1
VGLQMRRPSLISLFTGAGGLDLGLEDAGFETILANEINAAACETLRLNRTLRRATSEGFERWFKEHVQSQRCYQRIGSTDQVRLRKRLLGALASNEHYLSEAAIVEGDIRDLSVADILTATGRRSGEIDLVAGGPPCQPFSRAGKRELIECQSGQLFQDFVRIVDGLRPRWFLFENVKGLVIHKADVVYLRCTNCLQSTVAPFDARELLKDASNSYDICPHCGFSGTHEVRWENRRAGSLEVIIAEFERIGYKCDARVLNARDFGAAQSRERLILVGSRDGERVDWPEPSHACLSESKLNSPTLFEPRNALKPLQTVRDVLFPSGHWRYGVLDPATAVLWVKNVVRPHDEPVTWTLDGPAPTVGAHQAAKLAIAPFGVPDAQLARQQWHTLGRRQGDTPPVPVEHEYLTDEELLRLQTFPPSWYLHGTRMERAFQIGNAVPPVLAMAVGSAILRSMGDTDAQLDQLASAMA